MSNEITISRVIDELFQKGAEVIYDRNTPLHVSGHACQEELKMMLALTKPRYFIPVHGEYRMLCKHAEIGKLMGVEPKNVLVAKNGEVIEITKRSMRATSNVPAGDVYIDGTGIGDVGSAVLRDRRHLAEDGISRPKTASRPLILRSSPAALCMSKRRRHSWASSSVS